MPMIFPSESQDFLDLPQPKDTRQRSQGCKNISKRDR